MVTFFILLVPKFILAGFAPKDAQPAMNQLVQDVCHPISSIVERVNNANRQWLDAKYAPVLRIVINAWMDIILMELHVFYVDLQWKAVNFVIQIQYVHTVQLVIIY